MRKYLFDVECLVRDGESFFSLYFKDLSIIANDKFQACFLCEKYVLNFMNVSNLFDYVIVRMECD